MAADSLIRASPSIMKGMVPSGFTPRYSFASARGGKGSIFSSQGRPISSSVQSGRKERALVQW